MGTQSFRIRRSLASRNTVWLNCEFCQRVTNHEIAARFIFLVSATLPPGDHVGRTPLIYMDFYSCTDTLTVCRPCSTHEEPGGMHDGCVVLLCYAVI